MSLDVLPDSRLKTLKGAIERRVRFPDGVERSIWWVPVYCANCGKLGCYVPEENMTFAFWLCDSPCGEQWAHVAGTYAMPDQVFFERLKQEQLEEYGRHLTATEQLRELEDPNSLLSKLARDRGALTPAAGG